MLGNDAQPESSEAGRGLRNAPLVFVIGVLSLVLIAALTALVAFSAPAVVASTGAKIAAPPAYAKLGGQSPNTLAWRLAPSVTANNLHDVQMLSAGEGWAVGENDTILHYNGTTWAVTGYLTGTERLQDVFMLTAADGWITSWDGGTSNLYHWDGSAWTFVYHAERNINRISGVASNDLWAAGVAEIYHYDGTQWRIAYNVPAGRNAFAIQQVSPNEVWVACANRLILHYLNGTWTSVVPSDLPQTLYDIFCTSVSDCWATGYTADTYIMHYDGVEWSRAYTLTQQVSRLYFFSPTEGWGIGYSDILHYQNNSWTPVSNPTTDGIFALWFGAPDNGWAVGNNGVMLHYYDDATPTSTATSTSTPANTSTTTATGTASARVTTTILVTVTATASSTPGSMPCTIVFNDVPTSDAFYANIQCLACRGVISGYQCGGPGEPCPGQYFRPSNQVTRAQISKMVALASGLTDNSTGQIFSDVPTGNVFYAFIQALANRGFIGGYVCGGAGEACDAQNRPYFRPNANTTRGQLAKIVSNTAGFTDDPGPQKFQDVDDSNPFFVWINRLSNRGIISGYPCGGPGEGCIIPLRLPYFRPNSSVSRGQTSKIVANTFLPSCQTEAVSK